MAAPAALGASLASRIAAKEGIPVGQVHGYPSQDQPQCTRAPQRPSSGGVNAGVLEAALHQISNSGGRGGNDDRSGPGGGYAYTVDSTAGDQNSSTNTAINEASWK